MIKINLLPTKAAKKKESTILQLSIAGGSVGLALIFCFFWNQMVDKKIQNEQVTINDLNAKLNKLKSVIEKVEEYKKEKTDLESKIAAIKQLNDQRTGPVKFLFEFSNVLPERAWVTSFKENEKQMTLEGVAMDGPTVTTFVDNLRNSKYFSNIVLEKVEQVSDKGQDRQKFYINCTVNYTPAGA
jgi:type IV pilus assembly protein PilN